MTRGCATTVYLGTGEFFQRRAIAFPDFSDRLLYLSQLSAANFSFGQLSHNNLLNQILDESQAFIKGPQFVMNVL